MTFRWLLVGYVEDVHVDTSDLRKLWRISEIKVGMELTRKPRFSS